MTRRDFVLIAKAVAEARKQQPANFPAFNLMATKLASVCADRDTSIGFDRDRFLRACGVSD